jgi:hypothetical protein
MSNLLFCDDPQHGHYGLADELMRQYGCRTRGELHEKLAIAEAWASEHRIHFSESHGNWFGYRETGPTVQLGYATVGVETLIPPQYRGIECPRYERLQRAALCLLIYSHPILKREVEIAPHGGPERDRWQRIQYYRDGVPRDEEYFESFAQYVAERWGDGGTDEVCDPDDRSDCSQDPRRCGD